MSFPFEVDMTSDVAPWVQLRNRIVYLIDTGYYKPGDQLPTVRGLASEVSMNFNTVNKAYLSLVNDGYIESTRGRGVFVCDNGDDQENAKALEEAFDECIASCRDLGLSLEDIRKGMAQRIRKLQQQEGTTRR